MSNINVAVFGEALIDFLQQPAGEYLPFIGGSPFNVARSFARQGLQCHYLSPISSDQMGRQIYQSAQADGILLDDTNRSSLATSLALVYKDENGQPSYRLYREAVADLDITAKRLLDLIPNQISLFHTGSLALVPQMLPVLKEVLTQLRRRNILISVDINIREGVVQNHEAYVDTVKQIVALSDIVKVSDEDLQLMGYEGEPEAHALALQATMNASDNGEKGLVVLTKGEHGARILGDNIDINQAVIAPKSFADTVGAGDTFFSAMLSQILRDECTLHAVHSDRLAYALKFGVMAATLNVEKVGCHPPSHNMVLERLKS